MRVLIALAMVAATSVPDRVDAQDVPCLEFLQLHQEALEAAQRIAMQGVALNVLPYTADLTSETAETVRQIGGDISQPMKALHESFLRIATRNGCITPTGSPG